MHVRDVAMTFIGVGAAVMLAGCHHLEGQREQRAVLYSANRCEGPPSGWSRQGNEFGEFRLHNTIAVSPDKVTWNGATVSAQTLHTYLDEMSRMHPGVSIQVVFDDRANCRVVRETRKLVSDKLQCSSKLACVEYSEAEYQAQASLHFVN